MIGFKNKREDEDVPFNSNEYLKRLFPSVTTPESAEQAARWIMKEYNFDSSHLRQYVSDETKKIRFSNVKYSDVAGSVGLHPYENLNDVTTFDLHRSRIPTNLFKSIVEDMDVNLIQYTTPDTVETRSHLISPIFNRLVAQFGFAFRNNLEPISFNRLEHYFKALGFVSFIMIEVKFEIGDDIERLDAIGQVIAELDACHWNNVIDGFRVPLTAILYDGTSFQFFHFNAETNPPSFTRGCFPGDHLPYRHGLPLHLPGPGPADILRDIRQISEIIFDLLLYVYTSSLAAERDRTEQMEKKDGKPGECLELYDNALKHAQEASAKFRDGETKRQGQDIELANRNVEEGMKALKHSIELVPYLNKEDLFMSGWDEAIV